MDEAVPEIEVIVGTYEEFLVGYKLVRSSKDKSKLSFEQSFTNHSHSGSIRSVGMVGKYLASGSTDEAIRLINMDKRVEHGFLQQQSGTINCLTGYEGKFLFSGASDGTICIWKCGSWMCEKTLHAHQGGVEAIAIHPSGKLALSVGTTERNLKTWNLIKGRTGFVTNLHAVGEAVAWSPAGTLYAVGVSSRVDVYAVETAKVVYSAPFGKRVSKIIFLNEETIVIGGDKPEMEVHSVKEKRKSASFTAHKTRVKDVEWVEDEGILVTASNCDEHIRLWKFDSKLDESSRLKKEPVKFAEVNTTCRITCLVVWRKEKLKTEAAAEEEEEVEESEEKEEMEVSENEEAESSEEEEPVPKKKAKGKQTSVQPEQRGKKKQKKIAAAATSRPSPPAAKTKKKGK